MSDDETKPAAKAKCPICAKETVHAFRPFCSKHCADVDLGRWFNGQYRVETEETPDLDDFPDFPANDDYQKPH